MSREKIRRKRLHDLRGLKQRMMVNIRKTSPKVILRIVSVSLIMLPGLVYALICSWVKMLRWRRIKVCKKFIRRHKLAFDGIDPETLHLESVSGGVSNSNQIWRCRKRNGTEAAYFVKIFVSAGSFWAKHLSLVSPFPSIYGGETHERFTVDMISRVQLHDRNIPVPKLIAYDAVEKVMVTELLEGENVDETLKQIAVKREMNAEDKEIIHQCGAGLAKVHSAGFSLIDTQPVNCIWVREQRKIYFTDLEYCTQEDRRAWDVGFFLCFLAIRLPQEIKPLASEAFLVGYAVERPLNSEEVGLNAEKLQEYLPIFQTILDIRQFTPEELFSELMTGP